MATSGSVGATTFTTRQVIDHAFRRCKLAPQQVVAEHLETALELLWLILTSITTKGVALWALDRTLLDLNTGRGDVDLPLGTLDIMSSALRRITLVTGSVINTTGLANSYTFTLDAASPVTQVGLLPAIAGTWSYTVQVSSNGGATYATRVTVVNRAVSTNNRVWHDISDATAATHIRIVAAAATELQISSVRVGNAPNDIPITSMARDSYWSLPNKQQLGRPNQFWYDRQRAPPRMSLWPVPSSDYVTAYLLALVTHRQIQDVGTLTQEVEVPSRWYMAIMCELARQLVREIKEADIALAPMLDTDADTEMRKAWDGEGDRGPVKIIPNIRGYTR